MALTFTRRTGATVRVDGAGTDENLPSVAAYGGTAEWTASGHVLGVGELGLDTTTGEMRAGNGSSAWASLSNVLSGTYARTMEWVTPQMYGAVGDGVANDTTALTNMINSGRRIYWTPGIYRISAPLPTLSRAIIVGPGSKLYPNFTTDWQTVTPTWGTTGAATVQYASGHGAIFAGASESVIEGMVFRSSSTSRTSADLVFLNPPNHCVFTNNVVQNMRAIADSSAAAWGASLITSNLIIGCDGALIGSVLDCKIVSNTFTSCTGVAVDLTTGSGFNVITGNRFEWGEEYGIQLYTGSRNNVITGNIFDAHAGPGIAFIQTTDPNTVTGNLFWRNGRGMTANHLDTHIYMQASTGQLISGNVFKTGGPDVGNAWAGPAYCVTTESITTGTNRFSANNTRSASKTSRLFYDRYTTSGGCLVIDALDLPAGTAPGGASDDIAPALSDIAYLTAQTVPVYLWESRQVNAYVSLSGKVALVGAKGGIAVTNASGGLGDLGGAHNLSYGGLAYTQRDGAVYASAQPDVWRGNGGWPVGQYINKAAPAAGGTQGWVLVVQGSPDVWKTFGVISA